MQVTLKMCFKLNLLFPSPCVGAHSQCCAHQCGAAMFQTAPMGYGQLAVHKFITWPQCSQCIYDIRKAQCQGSSSPTTLQWTTPTNRKETNKPTKLILPHVTPHQPLMTIEHPKGHNSSRPLFPELLPQCVQRPKDSGGSPYSCIFYASLLFEMVICCTSSI